MNNEIWVSIPGYEGFYEISNHGRVRRIAGGSSRAIIGRILKQPLNTYGYPMATLYKLGAKRKRAVHLWVWLAFRGPMPEGLEVNHIDGIKTNSHLDNLEAVTRSENQIHAHNLRVKNLQKHHLAKLSDDDVRAIRNGKRFWGYQAAMAKKYGINTATVWSLLNFRSWKHVK